MFTRPRGRSRFLVLVVWSLERGSRNQGRGRCGEATWPGATARGDLRAKAKEGTRSPCWPWRQAPAHHGRRRKPACPARNVPSASVCDVIVILSPFQAESCSPAGSCCCEVASY